MVDRLVDRSIVRSVMGGPLRPTEPSKPGRAAKSAIRAIGQTVQRIAHRNAREIASNRGQQPRRRGLALPFIRRPYGRAARHVARPDASHRVRRAADNCGTASRQPALPPGPNGCRRRRGCPRAVGSGRAGISPLPGRRRWAEHAVGDGGAPAVRGLQ